MMAAQTRQLTEEEDTILKTHFTGPNAIHDYIRLGPKGYVLTSHIQQYADGIRNMPLRSTDTFVVSYPRSGTTWTQELVWLIANDLDFDKAKSILLTDRFPFLEQFMIVRLMSRNLSDEHVNDVEKINIVKNFMRSSLEVLEETPSPRFIKSHLPLSLLPQTLETAKVVYVARDPKDVAVSNYHFLKTFKIGLSCNFRDFYYDMFTKNLTLWSPILEHVKEAWSQRHHPNLLFLFYEELSKDLKDVARRVSNFLGKQYTDDQLSQLCEHLAFDNFQQNSAVDQQGLKKLGLMEAKEKNFIRKGKAGGWREYFDEEMTQHAHSWMADNLRDTDLRYPQ